MLMSGKKRKEANKNENNVVNTEEKIMIYKKDIKDFNKNYQTKSNFDKLNNVEQMFLTYLRCTEDKKNRENTFTIICD